MGHAELIPYQHLLLIRSVFFFYGNAASEALSKKIAIDIERHWNEPQAMVRIHQHLYKVVFKIEGIYTKSLTEQQVLENTNPANNYFRIEEQSAMEVSFVDGLGSNTGYFLLANLLQTPTTAAHEYGHTLGLGHPFELDIRGRGVPGIMYPRGTLVDAIYQYNSNAKSGDNFNGGTINPHHRKVLQQDVDGLKLHKLRFDKNNLAIVGGFSSLWHDAF